MWEVRCGMHDVGCGMWDVECGMWDVGCGVWGVGCVSADCLSHSKCDDDRVAVLKFMSCGGPVAAGSEVQS